LAGVLAVVEMRSSLCGLVGRGAWVLAGLCAGICAVAPVCGYSLMVCGWTVSSPPQDAAVIDIAMAARVAIVLFIIGQIPLITHPVVVRPYP
jgi:hypothetical protein